MIKNLPDGQLADLVLETIDNFLIVNEPDTTFFDTLKAGADALISTNIINYLSVYMLDQESFEFQFKLAIPEEFGYVSYNLYPELVDSGVIGNSTSTGCYQKFNTTVEDKNYDIYIFPMIGNSGILGLMIVNIDNNTVTLNDHVIKLLCLFTRVIASKIEYFLIKEEEINTKKTLEQEVAFRTIKLMQSKKNIYDRIESMKTNLSTALPHEIRTPLNQIISSSDMLLKHSSMLESEEVNELLVFINDSAQRINKLMDKYILFAKLESIATDPIELYNLQQKITPSIESIMGTIIPNKFYVASRMDDLELTTFDTAVKMSEDLFYKIIEELTDNCLKFSEKGSHVSISCSMVNGKCRLEFVDHGIGMTEEQINGINAYIQFSREVREQQGAGLGLAIVRRIVTMHSGEFRIESEFGKYTIVRISLPIVN
jgi:signal transduction histidine kinase